MADTVNNDEAGDTQQSVLDVLQETALGEFVETFTNNIEQVYEYDAGEIQEFLVTFNTPHENLKFTVLTALRQKLHGGFTQKFPLLAPKKLYNRRKTEKMVNDIYILGYCVINNLEDARLNKVIKDYIPNVDVADENDDTENPPNNSDPELLTVCLDLRKSVNDLTKTVRQLQGDIQILKEELQFRGNQDAAEVQPVPGPPAPPEEVVEDVEPIIVNNEDAENGDDPQGTAEAAQPANARQPTDDDEPPRNQDRQNENDATNNPNRQNQQNQQNGPNNNFQLQRNQRQRARSGRAFVGPSRDEVQGQATRPMSIEGIQEAGGRVAESQPRTIYVGRLSDKTSTNSLRRHLNEVGIGEISDIIDLRCKVQGQSSFCLIADCERAEAAIYNPEIWPRGAKIRPFKEKPQRRPSPQNRNNSRNPRGPRLQSPNIAKMNSPQTVTPPRPNTATSTQSHPTYSHPPPTVSPWVPQPLRPMHPMLYDPMTYNRFSPLMWQSSI